jgi:protein-S-isoprenylcysteine O-methyltransferase Ste14
VNPWYAKAAVIAGSVVMIAIRAPHGRRSRSVKVVESRKGRLETILLTFAWISFFLPLLWAFSPLLSFADYPLRPPLWAAGVAVMALGLWIFHRSHADLGRHWSISLEVREGHAVVTGGVYARIRHPMYLALLLYSAGQALFLPNRLAGPCYLAVMALIVGCRLGPEERMMRDRFGAEWDAYAARTRRLVPGLF